MMYLLQVFWLWLAIALVLGLAVAWLTYRADQPVSGWPGLVPWFALLAAGTLVAVFRILPTRTGYWLDLAMLMLAAYLIGCLLAGMLRAAGRQAEPAPASAERVAPSFTPAPAAVAKPAPAPAPKPAPAASVPAGDLAVEPMKPGSSVTVAPEPLEQAVTGLSAPRQGQPDDLTRIYGIDRETEGKLNALGLYHFDQLAALVPGQRRWLLRQLGHAGRFPSWWWRWRYDAEQLLAGKADSEATAALAAMLPPVEPPLAPVLEGTKPQGLAAPQDGKADDLKRIKGIGKQNEGRLHGLGIWHFTQIAGWSAEEVKWVGGYLAFPGRIEREDWVGQAKILAAGGTTDFARRADAGEVATSRDETNDDGQGNVIAPVSRPAKPEGSA